MRPLIVVLLIALSAALAIEINPGTVVTDSLEVGSTAIYSFNVDDHYRFATITWESLLPGISAPNLLLAVNSIPTEDTCEKCEVGDLTVETLKYQPFDLDQWTGTWNLVLEPFGNQNVTYSLLVRLFSCEDNCSDHGTCDEATGKCDCLPNYMGPTCAEASAAEMFPASLLGTLEANGDWDIFHLEVPPVQHHAIRSIVITAHHIPESPQVQLFAHKGSIPSLPANWDYRYVLPVNATRDQRLGLCAHDFDSGGMLYIGVFNPSIQSVPYNVTATLSVRCILDCSGHGDCSPEGECICHTGYVALGCTEEDNTQGRLSLGVAWVLWVAMMLLGGLGYYCSKRAIAYLVPKRKSIRYSRVHQTDIENEDYEGLDM